MCRYVCVCVYVGVWWPQDITKTGSCQTGATITTSTLCTISLRGSATTDVWSGWWSCTASTDVWSNCRSCTATTDVRSGWWSWLCVVMWHMHVWKPSTAHILWDVWYVGLICCTLLVRGVCGVHSQWPGAQRVNRIHVSHLSVGWRVSLPVSVCVVRWQLMYSCVCVCVCVCVCERSREAYSTSCIRTLTVISCVVLCFR